MVSEPRIVTKGWGYETIWTDNENYCSKFLTFRQGKKSSLHYHRVKNESFFVLKGKFELTIVDQRFGEDKKILMTPGCNIYIPAMTIHQLHCHECDIEGEILEVSTEDRYDDNYRIKKGD